MNILIYFGPQLNPQKGGTERVACLIADYLKAEGHQVYYMASNPVEGNLSRKSVFLPDGGDAPTEANKTFLIAYIKEMKIDLILNEGASTNAVYLFSHQYIPSSVKIISHLHFSVMDDIKNFYHTLNYPLLKVGLAECMVNMLKWIKAPYNKWYALKNKRQRYCYMYENSDRVVVLSEKQKRSMEVLLDISESSKIVAIQNPLLINSFNGVCHQKENIILFVGRLDYASKRADRVLKVWHSVQEELKDWKMVIVGSGFDEQRLKRMSVKLGLRRVEFVGQTDSVPYYVKSKILLLTSNFEGTPMVIAEAMSLGVVPVVINSFMDADLLIKNNINGFLTTPFSIKEMSQKVIMLANNPKVLQQMSNSALIDIRTIDNFTYLRKWLQLAHEE